MPDEMTEEEAAAFEAQQQQQTYYPPMYPQPAYGLPPTMNLELAEFLLKPKMFERNDDNSIREGYIPKESQPNFWGYISPNVKLSNMSENQAKSQMELFQAIRTLVEASVPKRFKNINYYIMLDNLEASTFFDMTRGIEGFERKEFNAQYQHQIVGVAQPQEQGPSRPGMFSRMAGRIFPGRGY